MSLELFLEILIDKLETNGIKYCILRNYETLPTVLKQGDIDFLISEEHITQIGEIIQSIDDIHVVGVTRRQYVHNYFIYNIDKGGESRAIQIDFVFKFTYKGTSYIDIPYLLNNATIMKNKQFYIPSKFDETFLMFLPFYLSTATLNKKYEDMIISVFQKHAEEFKFFFIKLGFDIKLIDNFYEGIVNRDYKLLKELSSEIKRKIFFHNFSMLAMFSHFFNEIILRVPFYNSYNIKVSLNPKDKKEIYNSLDSFAKNIIFIDRKTIFDYFKMFKIQTNFTMYLFYKKDNDIGTVETLNEIVSFMPLQRE